MNCRSGLALFACCFWALAATAQAQEPPAPAASPDTTWHSPEPPATVEPVEAEGDAAAPGAAPGEDAGPAAETAPADGGAAAGSDAGDGEPVEPQTSDEEGDFVPTEKIRADSALSFPSDI